MLWRDCGLPLISKLEVQSCLHDSLVKGVVEAPRGPEMGPCGHSRGKKLMRGQPWAARKILSREETLQNMCVGLCSLSDGRKINACY